jgi:plasmid stabilization system protein ParE
MDRKLIWTEKASGDIEAIVRYIIEDGSHISRPLTIEVVISWRCEHTS